MIYGWLYKSYCVQHKSYHVHHKGYHAQHKSNHAQHKIHNQDEINSQKNKHGNDSFYVPHISIHAL